MLDATRRWLRRNRTTLLISAGVVGAGYVAGQYVVGKIQEARQRMSDDRISKEKYGFCFRRCETRRLIVLATAYGDDSSRTRRTAHTPSLPCFLPFARRSSAPCQSSRSPNNYSRNVRSDCGGLGSPRQHPPSSLPRLQALQTRLPAFRAVAMSMQVSWRAALGMEAHHLQGRKEAKRSYGRR